MLIQVYSQVWKLTFKLPPFHATINNTIFSLTLKHHSQLYRLSVSTSQTDPKFSYWIRTACIQNPFTMGKYNQNCVISSNLVRSPTGLPTQVKLVGSVWQHPSVIDSQQLLRAPQMNFTQSFLRSLWLICTFHKHGHAAGISGKHLNEYCHSYKYCTYIKEHEFHSNAEHLFNRLSSICNSLTSFTDHLRQK